MIHIIMIMFIMYIYIYIYVCMYVYCSHLLRHQDARLASGQRRAPGPRPVGLVREDQAEHSKTTKHMF